MVAGAALTSNTESPPYSQNLGPEKQNIVCHEIMESTPKHQH